MYAHCLMEYFKLSTICEALAKFSSSIVSSHSLSLTSRPSGV